MSTRTHYYSSTTTKKYTQSTINNTPTTIPTTSAQSYKFIPVELIIKNPCLTSSPEACSNRSFLYHRPTEPNQLAERTKAVSIESLPPFHQDSTLILTAKKKMAPTFKELSTGRAGVFWNCLCCPIFGTIGLLARSIKIYVFPCGTVLLQRLMVSCLWKYCCCCFGSHHC